MTGRETETEKQRQTDRQRERERERERGGGGGEGQTNRKRDILTDRRKVFNRHSEKFPRFHVRGLRTRMLYLDYITCLRFTIPVRNPRNLLCYRARFRVYTKIDNV